MGLFSSTKIFVSSVVYNLAGDEIARPDYLKSLVLGNMLTKTDINIADTIQSGYIKGPSIKLRNFFRWAEDNYDYIGMPLGGFFTAYNVDNAVVIANIPHSGTDVVTISEVVVTGPNVHYFALQWMFDNYPLQVDTAWTSDYDDVTNEIVVTLADTSEHRFTPVGWDQHADYIYTTYSISAPGTAAAIVPGTTFTSAWPSTAGYMNTASTTTPHTVTLNTTTIVFTTYSDATPPTTTSSTTSTTPTWDELHQTWEKTVYQGKDPLLDRIWSLRTIMYLNQTAHITTTTTSSTTSSTTGGVTKTVTTTVYTDNIVYNYSWRRDTQDITVTNFVGPKMFIYKLFSGIPALDAAVSKTAPSEQYYPFIPARLDNVMVDAAHFPAAYPIVKKAYKKSTAGKYDKFIYNIEHNEKIADIDFAYCVFGVSVNVLERDCREYMYRYLYGLMGSQAHGASAYTSWKSGTTTAAAANATWLAWKAAQSNSLDPLFGTPEPTLPPFVSVPTNEVRITSSSPHINANYDIRISWQYMEETTGTGLIEPGRKSDEIWWTYNGTEVLPTSLKTSGRTVTIEEMVLNWQLTATTWKKLKVVGMVHRNYIYKGKFVETGLRDGVADPKESGFIMPLHYEIYAHDMPLVKSTQMATACCFVVFNCYLVKKTGFFGSFFFKILLFVVVIAVSVYFPPASGLLGSNAAVGAALGFSGLSALVVGAVANFIAATLLVKIIGTLSTLVFGAKFGALFGAIAGFLAMTVGVGMLNGMNFSTAIHQLSDIRNIMGLANATGTGIQGYIQSVISDMGTELTKLQEQSNKQLADIHKLYADNIGYGRASFDAMKLIDYVPFIPEAPQVFLARTQMTGTDNIALQLGFISKFVDLTITTDLP